MEESRESQVVERDIWKISEKRLGVSLRIIDSKTGLPVIAIEYVCT